MTRFCAQLRVKPEALEEYLDWHRAVWPDLLRALESAGMRNYSIFSRGDGVLIAYFETEDREEAKRSLAASDANVRWQKEMKQLFDRDHSGADGFLDLVEVFNLEEQLRKL